MVAENEILSYIDHITPQLLQLRRQIHRYPELAFEEYQTGQLVSTTLTACEIDVCRGIARTGIVGLLRGTGAGRTIALRADMDALPIQEETGLSFSSVRPGVMHACGHDLHTAALLGTAMVLSKFRHAFSGTVKFIFQPAEEGPGGAKQMMDEGVLEGVDQILGAHVRQQIPVGNVGVAAGPILACSDTFDIVVRGKSCHGAYPHLGIDAVVVASQMILALQNIVSRKTNPLKAAVITVSSIASGQDSYNIVADEIRMKGTVRTFDREIRRAIPGQMERIIAGIMTAMGAAYTFEYHKGYPATINDAAVSNRVKQTMERLLGSGQVHEITPTMASEDMAYYLEKIPGSFFFVGSGNEAEGLTVPNHNGGFVPSEEAIAIMTKAMTMAALDLLALGD